MVAKRIPKQQLKKWLIKDNCYWLDVIYSAEYFTYDEYASLDADNKELIKMLASIVKTSKADEN